MRRVRLALILLIVLAPVARAALFGAVVTDPAGLCAPAIAAAERAHALPPGLLIAIGLVESGRRDPLTGAFASWPWTVDVDGEGHFYSTEDQAIAAVARFRAAGHASIDVGCAQINLQQHPDAFATLQTAFAPGSNAEYAAGFLSRLHDAVGNWLIAAGQYHSLTPAIAAPYRARVMAMMGQGTAAMTEGVAPTMLALAAPAPLFRPFPRQGPATVLRGLTLRGPPNQPVPTGRALAAYRAAPVRAVRRI